MWSLLSREGGGSRWDRVQREFTQFCLKHLRKDKFLATHFTVCHLQESALKGNMNPKKAHTPHRKISQPEKPKKQTKSLVFVSSDLLLWRWLESCAGLQLGLDLPSTDYLFELLLESWHLYRGHPSRPVQKVPAKNRISRNKNERKAQGDMRSTPPAFSLIPNNVNTALSRLTVAWCGL